MTDTKISELTELTSVPNVNDVIPIVDITDLTQAPSGSTKKIKYSTLSSPSLVGNGTAQYQYIVTGATPFAPAYSTGFLNISGGKTLAISNTLTFAGTDSTTMTFPASSTTMAGLSIANAFTQPQTITSTAAIQFTVAYDANNNFTTSVSSGLLNLNGTMFGLNTGGVTIHRGAFSTDTIIDFQGATIGAHTWQISTVASTVGTSGNMYFVTGNGFGTGSSGQINFLGGVGGSNGGAGGGFLLASGTGGSTSGPGGSAEFRAGQGGSPNGNGGNMIFKTGHGQGSGQHGTYSFYNPATSGASSIYGFLDFTLVLSSNKTFTFPNVTGTFALGTGATNTLTYWSSANVLTTLANAVGLLGNNGSGTLTWNQALKANFNNWATLGDVVNGLVAIGAFNLA